MATIVTRAGKGSALTHVEGDANFTNLNNDKMESFTLAGDSGTSQTIQGGNTLTISGGTGLSSVASATDTVTINLDNTAVTPASYTYASITVDAQGRITAASNGTAPSNVTVSDDTATNATRYIVFEDATSGTVTAINVASTKLTFNPSTGIVTATGFSGPINGTIGATTPAAGTFTTLTASSANVNVTLSPTGTGTVTISPAGALTINPTAASTINNTSIGATTASTGRFTTVTSTVATGTAPFTVTSTTNVANLNASTLNGATFAAPGSIGSTTASSGAFTTLSASSTVSGTGFSTYLASPPAIGGTTAAAVSATTLTFKDPREAIYDLGTTGGTIAPNVANGSVQKITLNSALTINAFTTPVAGQSLTLIIFGGTAYTSITSTMKFAGGIKTLTGTASCIDILSVYYDGTNYYASLNKGFA